MKPTYLPIAVAVSAAFAVSGAIAQAQQSKQMQAPAAGQAHAPMPKPASKNGVNYVVGGVGVEAQAAMKEMASKYNTQLTFAGVPKDNYLVDVNVKVMDQSGNTRFELPKAGPMLLAQLPPGTYDVVASYQGKEQKRRITVGSGNARATEGFSW